MTNQPSSSELESELALAVEKSQFDLAKINAMGANGATQPERVLIAQVIGVAETIKAVQRDLDDLAADFNSRIEAIRRRIGSAKG